MPQSSSTFTVGLNDPEAEPRPRTTSSGNQKDDVLISEYYVSTSMHFEAAHPDGHAINDQARLIFKRHRHSVVLVWHDYTSLRPT